MFCQRVILCQIIIVYQLIHASVKPHISTEILQHAEKPFMMFVTVITFPDRRNTPHGTTFTEQIRYEQIASFQIFHHLRTRILSPSLNDPYRLGIHLLHGFHHSLSCSVEVYITRILAFMKRVHRIIIRTSKQLCELLIIKRSYFRKTFICRKQERRTCKSIPQFRFCHIDSKLRTCIMRKHSGISRQNRFNSEFTHSFQDFFLKFFLLFVPTVRIRSTPTLKIVHCPPCKKSRTGNKFVYFLAGISKFQQHVSPNTLLTYCSQRKIYTVECHPIYFSLPTFPIPKCHGIRICAVIKIISQFCVRLTTFLHLYRRKHIRQICLHIIPSEINSGIVLQIPVYARSYINIGITSNYNFSIAAFQFEEIFWYICLFYFKLGGSTFIYSLEHILNRITPANRYGYREHTKHGYYAFHNIF